MALPVIDWEKYRVDLQEKLGFVDRALAGRLQEIFPDIWVSYHSSLERFPPRIQVWFDLGNPVHQRVFRRHVGSVGNAFLDIAKEYQLHAERGCYTAREREPGRWLQHFMWRENGYTLHPDYSKEYEGFSWYEMLVLEDPGFEQDL